MELVSGEVLAERHNWASRKVMERLGMRLAGEIRACGLIEGRSGVHDAAPFALYAIGVGG
jgi:RimJ/RimL family protein N-acetyltransferase